MARLMALQKTRLAKASSTYRKLAAETVNHAAWFDHLSIDLTSFRETLFFLHLPVSTSCVLPGVPLLSLLTQAINSRRKDTD